MTNIKLLLVGVLTLAVFTGIGFAPAYAQNQSTALERGYRTGYSDGYNAGFNDISNQAPRDIQSKEDYQRAERSYNQVWGPIEDFRDGYQQGFEAGYNAAYDRQTFNSNIPASLKRRSLPDADTTSSAPAPVQDNTSTPSPADEEEAAKPSDAQTSTAGATSVLVSLPRNSVLLIELLSGLSTDATQLGDRFEARVIDPRALNGATIQGRVTAIRRPGKVKGVAELQLAFESLKLADGRVLPFAADVVEVVQASGDGVATVDPEGGIRGKSSTKDDVSKVGAATGIGAIIGAIAGGGKGAAIGAAIGGGVGTGAVLNDRGKNIRLEQGQQLRIRTANDTQIAQNQ